MSVVSKRKYITEAPPKLSDKDHDDIFPDEDKNDESGSSSDSSEYSGLEEEPDTSDESDSDIEHAEIPESTGLNENSDNEQSTKQTEEGMEQTGKVHIPKVDEYEEDSSDEEDIRNTVGNIPMEWYREYGHIGYDVEGNRIINPKSSGDQLDEFLNKMDNPEYWRTVTNKMTGQSIVLTESDVNMIKNVQSGKTPSGSKQTYEPWSDLFSQDVMIHPVTNRPEHKRSFIPSKWEKLKVGQMVHAIKMGWMKVGKPESDEDKEKSDYYMLWRDDEESEISKRFRMHLPAPKTSLPGHAESYNPPPEFILNEEEEKKWKELDPEDRRLKFLPKKYSSMRLIPSYGRFINERFERCLDLYLCPRQQKMRMRVNPEDLIPKLPKPKDLQPFPTVQAMVYSGHTSMVRCISVDPSGQWLVSGSDDGTLKFWEVSVGRCLKTLKMPGTVKSMAWNPNQGILLIAATVEQSVYLINPCLGDKVLIENTDNMLMSFEPTEEPEGGKKIPVTWHVFSDKESKDGFRLRIEHFKEVSQVTWHGKGDYFATVVPKGDNMSVLIHQLSKRRSQTPFSKSKGLVQNVLFHPIRPFLFVATQRYVRIYNLLKQELSKKLMTNCKWVSSIAVHPGGDNVIVGSYDSRLSWFDLDLSTKPYQTLRHHKKALRQVCYHKRYPLFASASDDCTVIVCHGMVFSDLLQNPQLVPVKVLKGHTQTKGLGVLDCVFHPTQPWIFSSGSDGTIRLYT